jgi:hypothetical protein
MELKADSKDSPERNQQSFSLRPKGGREMQRSIHARPAARRVRSGGCRVVQRDRQCWRTDGAEFTYTTSAPQEPRSLTYEVIVEAMRKLPPAPPKLEIQIAKGEMVEFMIAVNRTAGLEINDGRLCTSSWDWRRAEEPPLGLTGIPIVESSIYAPGSDALIDTRDGLPFLVFLLD